MNKVFIFLIFIFSAYCGYSQTIDFEKDKPISGNFFLKFYGEIHYYQPIGTDYFSSGKIDAKRMVALFGYQFDRKTQFMAEWELEHANEMFLEQAFLKHELASNTFLKAGLLLIPMGIINENHEPTRFSSVERPFSDRHIIPSTWRDIGLGINGLIGQSGFKYQLYLVNGLLGYKNGSPLFSSSSTYRGGRQKGSKTIMSGLPSVSGQLEYFGLSKTKIGLSLYSGKSNSDAYSGLLRKDKLGIKSADSTTVKSNIVAFHIIKDFAKSTIRSQFVFADNNDSKAYNAKTGANLNSRHLGAYIEYILELTKNEKWKAFIRYEYLDRAVSKEIKSLISNDCIVGVNYFPMPGAVFKIEFEWRDFHRSKTDQQFFINSGIGVWF